MEHFQNPQNVGEISDPDGVGTVGNTSCGDIMQMFIKVDGNRISQATFKTFGCGAAIVTRSIPTERIKGSTIEMRPSRYRKWSQKKSYLSYPKKKFLASPWPLMLWS